MLTNQQMKAGRFLRWHEARKRIAWIKDHLQAGRTVDIASYTRVVRCKAKHIDMIKATRTGAYVQRGKNWDCIDGCRLTAY